MAVCLCRLYFLPSGLSYCDHAADRVADVQLSFDGRIPGRRVGVLEVGHEDLRARVERVDHHLPVHRPGDLDTAIQEVGWNWGDLPVCLADALRLGQKIG